MKRFGFWAMALAAFAMLLVGCAPKTTWLPLFDSPIPGRTSSIQIDPVGSTAPGNEGETDENALFATEAESMQNPSIVVYKSKHTLEVWDGETLMARMKVAVGKAEGAKQKSGDNKTPEGQYYICRASDGGRYYKSLFISYPNTADAQSGLDSSLITEKQYNDIAGANDNGKEPLWNTGLGGEIAITGTGTGGKDKPGDWTAGAVAVSDKDMDYLWIYIKVGVDVVINP